MDMMAYHRSDDITIDLMAATIDMMTGLPISLDRQIDSYLDRWANRQLDTAGRQMNG